jgi:RNA polymerase sigma factor (TIGR02999 family)
VTPSRSDPRPLDGLVASMYETLRRLAKRKLPGGGLRHSVDATELLHECYLKLAQSDGAGRLSRPEFLAMAGKVIRHVVVDRAREVESQKRGSRWKRVTLHEGSASTGAPDVDLLGLDEALQRLAVLDERQAKVVELRFFAGLSNEEIAGLLGISLRTVVGEWTMARAWLKRELSRGAGQG